MNANLSNDPHHSEKLSLQLLADTQSALINALNRHGDKRLEGMLETFQVCQTLQIARSSEGYLLLRNSGRFEASKLLVRPAMEAIFRIKAVQREPDLLYRILYTDIKDNETWLNRTSPNTEDKGSNELEKFTEVYRKQYPSHQIETTKIKIEQIAIKADLAKYYNTHYRLYSKFTHGSLKALLGHLDSFETTDTEAMLLFVFYALEVISNIGIEAKNQEALRKRLDDIRSSDGSV